MFGRSSQLPQAGARVSLVTLDANFENRLQLALSNGAGIKIQTIRSDLCKVNGATKSLMDDDLLIVDMNPENGGDLQSLQKIVSERDRNLPIIVVTEKLAGEAARKLLHLHITDWLPKSGDDKEFVRACMQAIGSRHSKGPDQATCIAFFPILGGVGNTTLAIASAFVLGARKGGFRPTCIADLNFQSGMVADYLDLQPNLQLNEVSLSPNRLDLQLLEMMLSRHRSGLSVLAAPQMLRDDPSLDIGVVARLLDLASGAFENVIIDLPPFWTSWTESVLLGADKVFIVTELTVPGLRQAKKKCDDLSEAYGESINLSVIVNKYNGRMLGGGLKKKDARALFKEKLSGFVSDCCHITREAIDRGIPLSEVRKSNKVEKDLSSLLSELNLQM